MASKTAFLTVGIVALCLAAPVQAAPDFPFEMYRLLKTPTIPSCVLCHASSAGGNGTITTPFGNAMYVRGLDAQNLSSVNEALLVMQSEAVDSDSDGTTDLDELVAGSDPNGIDYGFGCAAASAPLDLSLCAALVGWVALRWRRRR